ncbi:MAG: DUF1549 domain-containing protein, partial [Planctomycetes bacterium]|nr:DUF1549 domain-containing protein [Planctomycetota bacterium]
MRRACLCLSGLIAALAVCTVAVPLAAAPKDAGDHYGIPQVKLINEQIAAGWADAGLQPSADAPDGEWCRRVHLDLIGRVPTVAELQAFLAESTPAKKANLVNRLLGDDYVDEFARNFTDVWTTVLIGRDVAN